mmetsp:Transcript_18924/g.26662  ORF Transcript_18924/g.26662 Transcript_18924/m.26662 type:complete len:353 (+) Transcript_18924:2-1060(+)
MKALLSIFAFLSHCILTKSFFTPKTISRGNIFLRSASTDNTAEEDEAILRYKKSSSGGVVEISSKEYIAKNFPQITAEFIDSIDCLKQKNVLSENEKSRLIDLAKVLSRYGNLTLLMRGENVMDSGFKYYSQCTSSLSKDEFLGMLKTINQAFPEIVNAAKSFKVYADGIVSFENSYRATFEGPLVMADQSVIEPNGMTAISNVELVVVSFTDEGKLRSISTGVVVARADEYKDPEILEKIAFLETKIEGNKIKMESLAGQEQTIAYQKTAEEITNMETNLSYLRDKVDVDSNTGSIGGFEGLFRAVGLEWKDCGRSLIGKAPHKRVGGASQGGITNPENFPVPVPVYETME